MFLNLLQYELPQQIQMHVHFVAGIADISVQDCLRDAAMIENCIVFALAVKGDCYVTRDGGIQYAVQVGNDLIAAGLGNEFMEAGIGLGIRFSGPDARLHVRSLFLDGLFLPVACVGRGQHCGVWLEQQAHIKHIQCQPVIVIDEFEA